MAKKKTPKSIRDAVLDEYNHRCAVCGEDRPQIHHIDENHDNNDPMNLIPLCPNNHLNDQHNPTRQIPIPILQLFRKYKDPSILKPHFVPVFDRMSYLYSYGGLSAQEIVDQQAELCSFVSCLQMGSYYGQRIKSLNRISCGCYLSVYASDNEREKAKQENTVETRQSMSQNWDKIERLIVELLRYQEWPWIKPKSIRS